MRSIHLLLLSIALSISNTNLSATETRSLVVFDQDDNPCEVVDITQTSCGPVDCSGRYRIVFLTPCNGGVQLSSGWQGKHADTIIAFVGRQSTGKYDPLVAWEDARIFVRSADKSQEPWEGLEITDRTRKARFAIPPVSDWPSESELWGLKLPASASVSLHRRLEVFLAARPAWQRNICKRVVNIQNGPLHADTKIRSTYHKQTTTVLGHSITYRHNWLSYDGADSLFFIPDSSVNEGEVSIVSGVSSWSCAGESPPEHLFPSIELTTRSDVNSEPLLSIAVGGETVWPSRFRTIEGQVTFTDGNTVPFDGSLLNGCLVEWPGNCGTSGIFSVRAVARRHDGTEESLGSPMFEMQRVDELWNAASPFRAARLGTDCTSDTWEFGGTVRFTIPKDGPCCGIICR